MRRAGQPTCGVATALFVAICTVFLLPGILQALAVGYMWTYAFGGTEGWPLGAFCFWIGACVGAMKAKVPLQPGPPSVKLRLTPRNRPNHEHDDGPTQI